MSRETVDVPGSGTVSALLDLPSGGEPAAVLALAHGAGAGMEHRFMTAVAERLAARAIAVLRYQFPYVERGGRPDRPDVATETVAAAVRRAGELVPGATPFAGGKSFGGRMTTTAAARGMLQGGRDGAGGGRPVAGIVLFGFPLHGAGRPGTSRAEHLAGVPHPQLWLQGTRDRLADLDLLRPVLEGLGERATLRVVDGADHGFHVLKRSGRTDDDVLDELAEEAADWMHQRASDRSAG